MYLKWIIAKFCSKPRVSSSFYIMGNFFSSTVPGDSTSSVIITSNISGILSAVVATPTFSSLLVDFPIQTREALSPATLEISKSLPSNPSPTNEASKCTADCNAIFTVDNLRRNNDRPKDGSKKWIQVGGVVNSKQTDPDSTEAARARGTKTDSNALLIHQHIRTQPIEPSQSISHSAQDMHREDFEHQTPTTETITFKQQVNPSQVKGPDRLQTVLAQIPPTQAKSPLSPPPFRPPMVYFIPHVPIQLFGRPHGHHVQELMQ